MKTFLVFLFCVFHAGAGPVDEKDGCGTTDVHAVCKDLMPTPRCELQKIPKGNRAPFHLVATNKQTYVQVLVDSFNHNDSFVGLWLSSKLQDAAGKEVKSTGSFNKPHYLNAYCCNKDFKNDRSIVSWTKNNFSRQRLNIRWKRGQEKGDVVFWGLVIVEGNKCYKIRSGTVKIKDVVKKAGEQNFSEFGNKK